MENIAIKVDNVSKVYKLYDRNLDRLKEALKLTRHPKHKEHYALRDISFTVNKGEAIGIIGTNGAGKSTVLKIITGILSPTSGKVTIDGRISALLELGAGFNPEYTGLENVYLNGSMIGFAKDEIDERLDAILSFADIGDFINQPVKMYSSGMFVRLAFAVAINIDPEILIVDEALSVGDVFFQAKCYKKFDEFKKAGKTILFVSHDLSSIMKYCDRAILLDKGNKRGEGSPKEMVDLYKQILVGEFVDNKENNIRSDAEKDKSLDYGNKMAEIIDFKIIDANFREINAVEKGRTCTFQMTVRFNEDIESPIFAFTIKDVKGTEITGTNSLYELGDFGLVTKGSVKKISFYQEMNLQGGEYLLSLGCTGFRNGEFTVYHRLYDIANVTVLSDKNTVGYFDMKSKVTIE